MIFFWRYRPPDLMEKCRRYLPRNFGKDYWWEISPTRLLRDNFEDIFGEFLGTNQPAQKISEEKFWEIRPQSVLVFFREYPTKNDK